MSKLYLEPLADLKRVKAGDDLGALLRSALAGLAPLTEGDVLVVAQKIVSKAEARTVLLSDITPSRKATALARQTEKDPRLVELILRESRQVLRAVPGVLIVEHRLGFIHANAGIDHSNVDELDSVLLLPENPDASAHALAVALSEGLSWELPVVINDSIGRPWRMGVMGHAIGCAGILPLWDRRGEQDMNGRALLVTDVAMADELAAAASLVMGQASEAIPAVLIRNALSGTRAAVRTPLAARQSERKGISSLLRPRDQDLFR